MILKLDADGALVWLDGAAHHIPPATNNLVDATGAGDSFAGGFLARYLSGRDAVEAATFATSISAWVIEHPGARPTPDAAAARASIADSARLTRSRRRYWRALWRPPHAAIEHHRELRFLDGSNTTHWQCWHALRRVHVPSRWAATIGGDEPPDQQVDRRAGRRDARPRASTLRR